MKIKSAKRIEPESSRCIEVDSPDRLFAVGGETGDAVKTHNSVVQRNIIFGTILRPESWKFLGVDLKRVELSSFRAYSNVVLGIATELEDAVTVLRFGQQTMMKRYSSMEQLGVNNFLDLPDKGQALMIMVDEAGELLGSSGVKALAADTYIPNLNGRRNISEIEIGDTVLDRDGVPTRVLDKYVPQRQEQFDLTIGNSYSVDSGRVGKQVIRTGADHFWVVRSPLDNYEKEYVLMTRQLLAEMELSGKKDSWRIQRLLKPLDLPKQELPITPQLLGSALANENITLSDKLLAEVGLTSGEQRIPDRYLYAGEIQRQSMLQAILGVWKRYTTKNLYFIQDIQRLISSLGQEAVLTESEDGITISAQKAESEWFEIESLIPLELDSENLEEMYCLRVASETSQFLCTENFITTHNTDEGKEQDMLKGEASMIIGSVARLGRAAGVHLIIATQRPDASLIPGETKANLGVRINCGRTDSNASSMILGNGEGSRVKANPRGRLYLSIYGRGDHGQGFFAQQSWIDDYLEAKGLNPDGSPISQKQSRLTKLTNFEAEFGGDVDLDAKAGIDNTSIIEKIRREEELGISSEPVEDDENWGFAEDDWDVESEEPGLNQKENEPAKDAAWGGLELGGGEKKPGRAEDDWDSDLDALIEENFD